MKLQRSCCDGDDGGELLQLLRLLLMRLMMETVSIINSVLIPYCVVMASHHLFRVRVWVSCYLEGVGDNIQRQDWDCCTVQTCGMAGLALAGSHQPYPWGLWQALSWRMGQCSAWILSDNALGTFREA